MQYILRALGQCKELMIRYSPQRISMHIWTTLKLMLVVFDLCERFKYTRSSMHQSSMSEIKLTISPPWSLMPFPGCIVLMLGCMLWDGIAQC